MTGSRDFMDLGDGVRMNLSRSKTSANRLTITLDKETDTYRMRFYRMTVSKHSRSRRKTSQFTRASIAICWRRSSPP